MKKDVDHHPAQVVGVVAVDSSSNNQYYRFTKALGDNNVFDLGFKTFTEKNDFNNCPCSKMFNMWRCANKIYVPGDPCKER